MSLLELSTEGVAAVEAALVAAKKTAPAFRFIVICYDGAAPCTQLLAAGGSPVETIHVLQHAIDDIAENAEGIDAKRVAAVLAGKTVTH